MNDEFWIQCKAYLQLVDLKIAQKKSEKDLQDLLAIKSYNPANWRYSSGGYSMGATVSLKPTEEPDDD